MIRRRIGRFSPARWGRSFSRLNFRRVEECDVVLRWLDPGAGERGSSTGGLTLLVRARKRAA